MHVGMIGTGFGFDGWIDEFRFTKGRRALRQGWRIHGADLHVPAFMKMHARY